MGKEPIIRNALRSRVKGMLARAGYQISRVSATQTLELHVFDLVQRLGVNCVLDVGAHHGEYARGLRELGYAGRIVSFEPVRENFDVLSFACASDASWRALPVALGDRSGEAEIHVYSGHTFHSLLSPSRYGLDKFGGKLELDRIERIQIRRLDEVFDACLANVAEPRVFLKMDTQGYDLAVIEGAGDSLDRVVGLQTEVALRAIYEDMSTTLATVVPTLQQRGFGVTGLFPVSRETGTGHIVELDCVMTRG